MTEKRQEGRHPGIILISPMPQFPLIEDERLNAALRAVEGDPEARISWQHRKQGEYLGEIAFDTHRIRLIGLPAPVPQNTMDHTINVSYWQPQIKAGMRQHQSHLICRYLGDHQDPVEQMIALYKIAHALNGENLMGILNEPAWTAHPTADFLTSEKLRSYREDLPFILWVGYVKFFVDKENYWLVTKGHHIFDVPDLACFIRQGQKASEVMNQFINIFYYLYEQEAVLTPGDTMEIQGTGEFLRFTKVTEYEDYLMGPTGTLVVEKIDPHQINQNP